MSNYVGLTLEEICRIAFEDSIRWVAGNPSQVSVINWVTYLLAEIRAGDLLLATIEQVTQTSLLNSVASLDVAGVIVYGENPQIGLDFPQNLVVGVLAGVVDPHDIQRKLLTILINHRGALMERGVQIHTQLSHLAAEGSGLAGLTQAMAEITGHGIVIQDKRQSIYAQCSSPSLMGYWDEILLLLSQVEYFPENLKDRNYAGRYPSVFQQKLPGGLVRLITPIVVGEIARGYLSIISLENELDALDQLVLEQGSLVCAVEMSRKKAVRETEKRLKGDLLTALLQDNMSPRDALLWLQEMGIDPNLSYMALRFAWLGDTKPSTRRMETMINVEVARLGLKTLISQMGQEVVCFCPLPPDSKSIETALNLGKAVLARQVTEFPSAQLCCGIGAVAPELMDWRRSFRQAGQALEMARRLRSTSPLYFPNLSVYRLLSQIEYNPELSAFYQETLGPLLKYEGANELVHTLEAYFEHTGNLSQTADALFIHRNTLNYRMARICEILDIDLSHPESRLALQLALLINRMLNSNIPR